MKKHLFLTGPSGYGKTTMIRNALGGSLAFAGGFVTRRVSGGDGKLLGFDLLPAAAAGGVEGYEPLWIMDYSCDPPVTHNEIFRTNAVKLLQEAEYYPFSVIDEFGGFELVIPQFRQALSEFLSSEQPCIGVIKNMVSAGELRARFGLGEKYTAYINRLYEALNADSDTLILEVRSRNDERAERIVRQWAAEYAL